MKQAAGVIVLLFLCTLCYGQWTVLNSGTTSRLYDVEFPEPTIGYVGGDSIILKTTDGINWFPLTSWPQGGYVGDMCFLNKDTGFVSSTLGLVYRTYNGGTTWDTCTFPVIEAIIELRNIDDSLLIVAGNNGLLVRSTDYGNTWNLSPNHPCQNLLDITFSGIDTIIAIEGNNNSRVFYTHDGGYTWDTCIGIGNNLLMDVSLNNNKIGFAGSRYSGIYYTNNGGVSWQQRVTPNFTFELTSLIAIDSSNYATCGGGYFCNTFSYIGYNNGANYIYHDLPDSDYYAWELCLVDDSTLVIVGDHGYIVKSSTVLTSHSSPANQQPNIALSMYPNPADQFIQIILPDETVGNVALTVSDVTGREVYTYQHSVGNTNVIGLDVGHLAEGLYTITMVTNDGKRYVERLVIKH